MRTFAGIAANTVGNAGKGQRQETTPVFHNYPQQTVILMDLELLTAVIVPLFAPVRQSILRRKTNFFASEAA